MGPGTVRLTVEKWTVHDAHCTVHRALCTFVPPMNTERIEQLRGMLAEEPGDLFLRYAIALELKRSGAMEQAVKDLEAILTNDPKHIASYYQLALMQADLGRTAEARATCEAGMLQCIVTGDRKARVELQELRNSLADEE
jgi:predicted Zn-dependent protease